MRTVGKKSASFDRRSARGGGCTPLLVLLLVMMGVVVGGRHWIGQRLSQGRTARSMASLADAFAAFDRGDMQSAVDYASQVVEREGADAGAYDLLVRALIYRSYSEIGRETDRDSALDLSREAVSKWPRSVDAQALYAFALQAAESADEAGRIALRIVERDPEHVFARVVLSLSYGGRGFGEAALREAEAALYRAQEQQRYEVEGHRALALAYGSAGKYRGALEELKAAVGLNGKLIPLHFETALYALQLGDADQATVSYYTIMALDKDNVKVRARLCALLERLQDRVAALRYCNEVTELAPAWASGWFELGRLHFFAGDYKLAQSAFGQCSRLQVEAEIAVVERQLECWYLQGQSAEILGDCDSLALVYGEFKEMARVAGLPQTWSYPPNGPPNCVGESLRAGQAAWP